MRKIHPQIATKMVSKNMFELSPESIAIVRERKKANRPKLTAIESGTRADALIVEMFLKLRQQQLNRRDKTTV